MNTPELIKDPRLVRLVRHIDRLAGELAMSTEDKGDNLVRRYNRTWSIFEDYFTNLWNSLTHQEARSGKYDWYYEHATIYSNMCYELKIYY